MRAPILDPLISTEPNDRFALREKWSVVDGVLRAIVGLVPLAGGTLVAYVLLSGNRPKPFGSIGHQILGWVTIAVFLTVLGIVPIYWGLEMVFMRRAYFIHLAERELQSSLTFAGLPLRRRRYPLSAFGRVLISCEKRGVFSTIRCFVVSCDGPVQHIDLAEFSERMAAEKLAEEIGRHLGLPVEAAC